jgi:hypothetical protein
VWCMHRRPHRRPDGADPSPSNDACLCPCTQPHTSPPPIQWAGRSSLSTYRSAGPGLRHPPTIGTPAVVAVAWHVAAAAAVVVLRPSSHVRRRRRHGSVCVERGAWVSELETGTLCERVENIIDRSLQVSSEVNRFLLCHAAVCVAWGGCVSALAASLRLNHGQHRLKKESTQLNSTQPRWTHAPF